MHTAIMRPDNMHTYPAQASCHTQQHYLQTIDRPKKLSHGMRTPRHSLHKLRLFLHGLQSTDSCCGQVGRQRGAVTVAKARQTLVVNNVSVPSAEASYGC